jgi:hypothetical protein
MAKKKITITGYDALYPEREKTIEGPEEMDASDGYHTFKELYDHRITLFIALCDQIAGQAFDEEDRFSVWRSHRHSDGKKYDGWFIMGIGKENGSQITYHIPEDRWDETGFAETLANAPTWDGHKSEDVIQRLKLL